MIDFLSLEHCVDLDLVQISQECERRGEMLVFITQSMPYSHTGELVIRSLQIEGARAQLLNACHGLLDSSTQSWAGLVRTLSDGETLVICDKVSAGLLLHKEHLQCLSSGCGVIILLSSDVNSLVLHQIEH
jgi:hypothetical protein